MNDAKPGQGASPMPRAGWKAALKRALVRQFGRPVGFWGGVAGQIMARRPSNVERNLWTVELLDIQPTDRVLEIGFGPGIGIAAAAHRVDRGLVVGVDHSEVMLRQAERRNRAAIRRGRVELRLGSINDLVANEPPFDKIFAVNSIAFWPEPVARLGELRALLTEAGLVAITEQPRLRRDGDEAVRQAAARITSQLAEAGFGPAVVDILPARPVAVVCVRAPSTLAAARH